MRLDLKEILAIPLKDRLDLKASEIWGQSLSCSTPEYISVLAPSGSGKTTLIHALYGLRHDFTGEILWNQVDLKQKNPESLAALRAKELSIIFQDMRLFPELSTWENLELKRSLYPVIEAKEVKEWLQRLGIGDKGNSLAHTLSYGEQQRVAIIRALLQPFNFLLMDEPFSHLDQSNKKIAAQLILEITQRNQAGILIADLDKNDYFPYTKTWML